MIGLAELPAADLAPYTPVEIEFAVSAWPMRAAEELRSALVFRALAAATQRAGFPATWSDRFIAAAREEVGHAELCARVGARLGATAPRYDSRPVRRRIAPLRDPLERAAALLLVEVAIGETISTSMFRAGRRASIEPLTRAALEAIVADEIGHQQLGWSALSAWWSELGERSHAAMQEEARRGLAGLEARIAAPALARLESGEPFSPAHAALGVLEPSARVQAFYEAIEHLVIPKLSRLGLDGARAWSDRYRNEAVKRL